MSAEKTIRGKTVAQWETEFPIMSEIRALKETAWINPGRVPFDEAARECVLSIDDVRDAEARLARFADYFEHEFPETAASHGIIESPVRPIPGHAAPAGKRVRRLRARLDVDQARQPSAHLRLHQGARRHLRGAQDR